MQFSVCKLTPGALDNLPTAPWNSTRIRPSPWRWRGTPNCIREIPVRLWSCFSVPNLSPRDPRGWFITRSIAVAYFHGRQFDEAISAARRALDQNPRDTGTLRTLAAALV